MAALYTSRLCGPSPRHTDVGDVCVYPQERHSGPPVACKQEKSMFIFTFRLMLLLFFDQPSSEYRTNIHYKLMGTDLVCCYINRKRIRENKVLGSFVEYLKRK
jgi:hypothetical protein